MKQTGSHLSGAASFTLRCEMQTTGLHPQAQRQAPSLAVPPGPSKSEVSESKEQRTNAELQIGAEPRLASPLGGFGARNRPQTMQPKHSTETCTKRDVTPSHPIISQEKR